MGQKKGANGEKAFSITFVSKTCKTSLKTYRFKNFKNFMLRILNIKICLNLVRVNWCNG